MRMRIPSGFNQVLANPFSFRRAVIAALVVFMHGLLGLLLLRPATPWLLQARKHEAVRSADDVLKVTLISPAERRGQHGAAADGANRGSLGGVGAGRVPKKAIRHDEAPESLPNEPQISPRRLSADQLPEAIDPAPASSQYIAGGRSLQKALRGEGKRRRKLLPDNHDPHVPVLAMRDPRSDGVAGLIRRMGGLFGADDPACLKADAYRGMSDVELAQHNTSRSEVESTLTAHGCPG